MVNKILFYGNCQMDALKQTLEMKGDFIACYNTKINENDFHNIIITCDIIFTQSIKDNYHNKHYLSTSYIINNCKKSCKIIICANNYMKFYYFDSFISNKLLKPTPYHYNSLMKNIDKPFFIKNVLNNIEFKNLDYLNDIVKNDINELQKREEIIINNYKGSNIYYCFTSKFIEDNYKDKLLFYTINHPTKHIFQYMAHTIIQILNLNIKLNENIDPLKNNVRQLLYKTVEKVIYFNVDKYQPQNINSIVNSYHECYNNKDNIMLAINNKYIHIGGLQEE
jgi:hypothetical protein